MKHFISVLVILILIVSCATNKPPKYQYHQMINVNQEFYGPGECKVLSYEQIESMYRYHIHCKFHTGINKSFFVMEYDL